MKLAFEEKAYEKPRQLGKAGDLRDLFGRRWCVGLYGVRYLRYMFHLRH